MEETLNEQCRVNDDSLWIVKFCCWGRMCYIGNDITVTVPFKKAPANYVPAAAVIRREQALSGFIGCKGYVGGLTGLWFKPGA